MFGGTERDCYGANSLTTALCNPGIATNQALLFFTRTDLAAIDARLQPGGKPRAGLGFVGCFTFA